MKSIDCAIAIIFNDKNQILLTLRNDPKSSFTHRKWQFPGGGVEKGESPTEACLREILEETGLIIELLSEESFRYDHPDPDEKAVVRLFGYPAKWIEGKIDLSKEEETLEAKWFEYKDIPFNESLPFTKELVDDSLKYLHDIEKQMT